MYEAVEITRGPTQTRTDTDDVFSILQPCHGLNHHRAKNLKEKGTLDCLHTYGIDYLLSRRQSQIEFK